MEGQLETYRVKFKTVRHDKPDWWYTKAISAEHARSSASECLKQVYKRTPTIYGVEKVDG